MNDFDCYQRAELIPDEDILCGVATRQTQFANATHPAAEVAAHLSAALAASAALLQEDDPTYAVEAMTSAYALYDFGIKHNKTTATWNADVQKTYTVGDSGQFLLYAAAMITWAHRCENENLSLIHI